MKYYDKKREMKGPTGSLYFGWLDYLNLPFRLYFHLLILTLLANLFEKEKEMKGIAGSVYFEWLKHLTLHCLRYYQI